MLNNPMNATGQLPTGQTVTLTGHSSSELERAANKAGCIAYNVQVDGGIERIRKIAGEWVVFALSPSPCRPQRRNCR